MESQTEPIAKPTGEAASGNERSTIEFSYTDVDNALEIAQGVHQVGGTACQYDQLAAHLGAEAKGGGFRQRIIGAKTFELVTYERGGRITLTELGRQIIDPHSERAAKATAFLRVPLYARIFEQFKGGPLPPQAALERAMVSLGVGAKTVDRARQVMLRSARQAGYFELSQDRMTAPPIRSELRAAELPEAAPKKPGGHGGGGDDDLHPLINGLLLTLPKPPAEWPLTDRLNWLNMANSIFKMIYPSQQTGEVEIKLKD